MIVKKPFHKVILSKFIRPYKLLNYNLICLGFKDNVLVNSKDLFENLNLSDLKKLKDSNTFILLDNSFEGYSYKEFEIYSDIHRTLEKYNINYKNFFYISSNLYETENYKKWCLSNNISNNINIVIVNYWDYAVKSISQYRLTFDETIKNINEKQFFLCLNRRLRSARVFLIYKLFESKIYDKTNISFDSLKKEYFYEYKNFINENVLDDLIKRSPSILDIKNFEINQADSYNQNLFYNSIISLVSETLSESHNGTSLFYSEKTFKPMCFNHPIMLFGQQNCNLNLTNLGYKVYDCYFNLDFDNEPDIVKRYNLQINELEKLSNTLLKMTSIQKIDWLAQGKEILEHNQQMVDEQTFNKNQALNFLKIIEN